MPADVASPPSRWLTAEEATARLGVSRPTLYSYVSRSRIGAVAAPDGPRRSMYDAADVRRLRASAEPGTRLAGRLLAHRDPATSGDPTPTGGLGDAGAVCAVADPTGLTTSLLPVEVSLAPGPARGQTVVDRRPRPGESELDPGRSELLLANCFQRRTGRRVGVADLPGSTLGQGHDPDVCTGTRVLGEGAPGTQGLVVGMGEDAQHTDRRSIRCVQ